jgi:uncharacterized protein
MKWVVVIVDTGIFVAAALTDDRHHKVCADFLRDPGDELGVSDVVVSEVSHLLKRAPRRPGPEVAFLRRLADGSAAPLAPTTDDYARMADLVAEYHDLPLGAADASIVALAERLGVKTIATVDRRDFGVVRPRHVGAFQLVPAL